MRIGIGSKTTEVLLISTLKGGPITPIVNMPILRKLVTVSDQVSEMESFLGTAQSSPTEIIIRLDIGIQRPLIIIQLGKDTQRI